MSRCFPYLPPDHVLQFDSASLIESLKKVEKAKNERKEKKRDKKENEKTRGCGEIDEKKHKHKRRNKHKRHQDDGKGQEHQKRRENAMEHLENSSLTEEYGHRVNSQNSCDSSKRMLNHNKRHRTSLSHDGCENYGSASTLILSCQSGNKHDQTENNLIQEGITTKASQDLVQTSWKETSHMSHNLKTSPPPVSSSNSPYELKFRNLFENWFPPSSCSAIPEYDDQEWLFSPKRTKRIRGGVTDGSSYYEVSTSWPRVCHLPELDLYALPFTVPY